MITAVSTVLARAELDSVDFVTQTLVEQEMSNNRM